MNEIAVDEVIEKIKKTREKLWANRSYPVNLPDPNWNLDLASRGNDQQRQFKHLHQSCLMHTMHFKISNQIKLFYFIDGLLDQLKQLNPFGVTSFSRAILEQNAFCHRIYKETHTFSEGDENSWKPRGEGFFSRMIRARYGTSWSPLKEYLGNHGLSKKKLEPYNITECIRKVSAETEYSEIIDNYDWLCEFVHQNIGSQAISRSGTSTGQISGGGRMSPLTMTNNQGPITTYEYPSPTSRDVINTAIPIFERNLKDVIRWSEAIPDSPYSEKEILERTGTKQGMPFIPFGPNPAKYSPFGQLQKKVGRNEPCPCGSGKKYKHCCMP
jgi:hypothetical protein